MFLSFSRQNVFSNLAFENLFRRAHIVKYNIYLKCIYLDINVYCIFIEYQQGMEQGSEYDSGMLNKRN